MEHGVGRQLSHDVLEQYRFRAIELRKKDWSVIEIAEAFGLNRRAVTRWFTNYNKYGKKSLQSRTATGPEFKLKPKEMKILLKLLKHPATDFEFETPLWTCKRVLHIIKKQFKKKLDYSNVWRLLQKLGLTNQKPERRAIEQDPKETKRWLKEEWPRIQAHARRWQAVLYFQDEAGVSLTPVLGKTWAPKGKTPIVRVTGHRGGLIVTSAMSTAGRLLFRFEKERITADLHIEFLEQVREQHKNRKVIIVEDQAPPHIARKVGEYVEKHKKSFAIYYLPPYSPELNPDEDVWQNLKGKLKTHQAQSVKELKEKVNGHMKSIQKRPELVRSFFNRIYVN